MKRTVQAQVFSRKGNGGNDEANSVKHQNLLMVISRQTKGHGKRKRIVVAGSGQSARRGVKL